MAKIPRAYSYEDIKTKRFDLISVDEEWLPHLGKPQLGDSSWLVYGGSGHGKTSYVLQLVRMLCTTHGRVHYNSLEEGMKESFRMALDRNNIKGVKSKFTFHSETFEELTKRLSRNRQPKVVVIDSVQYFFRGKKLKDYFEFKERFKGTTFIWVSGADGKNPKGSIAGDIYYDSDIVVHVADFEAIIEKNRYEAYENRIVWKEEYERRNLELLSKG